MPFYIYALLGDPPDSLPAGLTGEPLRSVSCSGIHAVVGEVETTPAMTEASLVAQDEVVRQIAKATNAVLPARFGMVAPDLGSLVESVRVRAEELARALALVRGREQMTARMFRHRANDKRPPSFAGRGFSRAAAGPKTRPTPDGEAGPGTRYLVQLSKDSRAASADIEEFDAEVAPLIRAERVVRHDSEDLVASVYHLIDRGQASNYKQAVDSGRSRSFRVRVSGPHPPYAFVGRPIA